MLFPDTAAALDASEVDLGPTAVHLQPATTVGNDEYNNQHIETSFTAASLGHGFTWPVAAAAVNVTSNEIPWATLPPQAYPLAAFDESYLAALSSKYKQPHAAAAAVKSDKRTKRHSNTNKPQHRQVVLSSAPFRKRKASTETMDSCLAPPQQAAATASLAAAGQARPAKRQRSKTMPEQQQQQQGWPMELEFAGQYWADQAQHSHLQDMQWAPTAEFYSDSPQAGMAATIEDDLLQGGPTVVSSIPSAAAVGDDSLQPPHWLAGINLAGHETSADVLASPQLSVYSSITTTTDWTQVDIELAAAEEAFHAALQNIVPLELPKQTPWQPASHQAVPVAPAPPPSGAAASNAAAFVQGQQPWQEQQQQFAPGACAADLAELDAGVDILEWLADADLAAMEEGLDGHQALPIAPAAAGGAAGFVLGQEPWQQQQGAANISAADLAAQLAAGELFWMP